MALEAQYLYPHGEIQVTATAAVVSGEVRQLPDGRAAVRTALKDAESGDQVCYVTEGVFSFNRSTTINFLPGQEVYWDAVNNLATYKLAGTFLLGVCCEEDTVAAGTGVVKVDLNKRTNYVADTSTGSGITVMTSAGLFTTAGMPKMLGGDFHMQLIATNEAECVDFLSEQSIAKTGRGIAEFEVNVDAAAGSATDLSIGIANATSTTDADAIAESVFFHIDGGSQVINAESDDGTTEVNATDTTKVWAAGTRFFGQIDFRDPASVKLYINGVRVLSGTTFVLTAATGPFKLLLHLEKTAATNTASVRARGRMYQSQAA